MTWGISGYGHRGTTTGDEKQAEQAFRQAARALRDQGHYITSLTLNGKVLFSENQETPEE